MWDGAGRWAEHRDDKKRPMLRRNKYPYYALRLVVAVGVGGEIGRGGPGLISAVNCDGFLEPSKRVPRASEIKCAIKFFKVLFAIWQQGYFLILSVRRMWRVNTVFEPLKSLNNRPTLSLHMCSTNCIPLRYLLKILLHESLHTTEHVSGSLEFTK